MNNKFIKSTIILLLGSLITKILGMIIKIIITRSISTKALGIYSLVIPTMSLLICIAQFSIPSTLSKLVAEDTRNNKKLLLSIIPISLLINTIIILIILFLSKYISINLLHNKNTLYPIKCIAFTLPFISISSILRGYFFGKQKILPHVISNITEDLVRLIITIIFLPYFIKKGTIYTVSFIILSNIISELTSILVLFFFLPKNFHLSKKDLLPKKNYILDIFNLSIPSTISRLIGNIGYFFEPIILTQILLYKKIPLSYIEEEYGILNGYIIPLLILPSFFTMTISQVIIPIISKAYINNDYKTIKTKLNQSIIFSLLIALPISFLLYTYPTLFLKTIYKTSKGINYLKILTPFFILQYIQSPISSTFHAMGKTKLLAKTSLYSIIIKLSSLTILSILNFKIYSLIISIIINIIFITTYNIYKINKILKKEE